MAVWPKALMETFISLNESSSTTPARGQNAKTKKLKTDRPSPTYLLQFASSSMFSWGHVLIFPQDASLCCCGPRRQS